MSGKTAEVATVAVNMQSPTGTIHLGANPNRPLIDDRSQDYLSGDRKV